jgi:hypothetical protein
VPLVIVEVAAAVLVAEEDLQEEDLAGEGEAAGNLKFLLFFATLAADL